MKRGFWIDGKVEEIIKLLSPDLPKTLRLEEQGRFAVGYYHERASRPEKKAEANATGTTEPKGEQDQ